MAKVIRVFGKADAFDIEFSRKGEKWTVDIPPDMTDGVYAVQLTAIDSVGESAYWTGELYMVDGVCCLKINELPYRVKINPKNQYDTHFSSIRKKSTIIKKNEFEAKCTLKTEIFIRKGCCCYANK